MADETFGNTGTPEYGATLYANEIAWWGGGYSPANDGTATSMSVYAKNSGKNVELALYEKTNGGTGDKVAKTAAVALGAGYAWKTANFAEGIPVFAAKTYLLCVNAAAQGTIGYDSNMAANDYYKAETYGTWPDSIIGASYQNSEFALYCTYAPGNGVEHTHFSTDTMGISDSIKAAMTFNVPLSDTLSIGDSLATVAEFKAAISDTMSISDSLAALKVLHHSASDTMSISDSLLVGIAYVVALADQMNISDSLAAEKIYHVALDDTMGISDSLLPAATYNIALDDRLSISDSILAAATYNIALADTLGISDSLAVAATYAIALADTMGISDSLAAGWVFYVSLTDQMEISDSLSVAEIEAVIRRIRKGQIYGFKPARVVKVGRVGV